MTKDKDFKATVRARMAKTGERYAAARAQLTGTAAVPVSGLGPRSSRSPAPTPKPRHWCGSPPPPGSR